MIKVRKNPYRNNEIGIEDAYKLGEVLELIYRLELSKDDWTAKAENVERYMNKLNSQFPSSSRIYFNKGRKNGEKELSEIIGVLSKRQLKKYQDSLIEEVELLKYKNNL